MLHIKSDNQACSITLIVLITIFFVLVVASCDIINSLKGDDTKTEEETEFSFYTNVNDALLMSAVTIDGDSISYFGERDERGVPINISGSSVFIKESLISANSENFLIQNKTFDLIFGGLNNQPRKIITEDFTFLFDWETNQTFTLTSIDHIDNERIQVYIDLTKLQENSLVSINNFVRDIDISSNFNKAITEVRTAIYIERCGLGLDNAWVSYYLKQSGSGGHTFRSNAPQIFPSTYLALIPIFGETMNVTGDNVNNACLDVFDTVGLGCEYAIGTLTANSVGLCSTIAVASTLKAPIIMPACLGAIKSYQLYCKTMGFGSIGDEGHKLDEYVCSSLAFVIDRGFNPFGTNNNPMNYSVYVSHPSLKTSVERNHPNIHSFDPQGVYPSKISIDIDGEVAVESFYASPSNPPAGVGYTVHADLSCLLPQTTINLRITGTDGYYDSKNCYSSLDDQSCSLYVPGAEGGVRDQIELWVGSDNMENLSLLTVIFGGTAKVGADPIHRISRN